MGSERRLLEEMQNLMGISKCTVALLIVSGREIQHVKSILGMQHPGKYFQLTETLKPA